MNLLFDIDDTITNETEFMLKYAPIYLKRKFHDDFYIYNPNGYDVSEVFNLGHYFRQHGVPEESISAEMRKVNSGFWNKYFVRYMFYPIKSDVSKTINELRNKGFKINFVSSRGKKTHENENSFHKLIRTKIVPWMTKTQLKANHIKYDELILVQTNEEKVEVAKKLGAKCLFDDNLDVLRSLDDSILAVCIETSHNVTTDLSSENITRIPFCFDKINECVNNLGLDVEPKKESGKKKKIKNLKLYQKVYTESFYRLVRTFGKGRVLQYYNPIVIGEENLPKQQEVSVFVGNHRNIKDPLITVSLLKKPTHFAALKRMFEYNENLFGPVGKNLGTVATTLFVKSMGALPIARVTDTDYKYTNIQTFKYIREYLKLGSDIAIYPEGTLNRNPDENGNILPLKSNQAFKIAENGKAIVRPVSIVWIPKELNIENKVIISFLKPIHTEGLKAKEISEKWQESMNASIDAMNKIVSEMSKIASGELTETQEIDELTDKILKL